MSSIRIQAITSIGDMETETSGHSTIGDPLLDVRSNIITAANRILRGYGLEEIEVNQ